MVLTTSPSGNSKGKEAADGEKEERDSARENKWLCMRSWEEWRAEGAVIRAGLVV